MALSPLSRTGAWIVIANALVGAIALAVVVLVEPAGGAVRGWLDEIGVPFGVVLMVATASVVMWLAIGSWSLSKARDRRAE